MVVNVKKSIQNVVLNTAVMETSIGMVVRKKVHVNTFIHHSASSPSKNASALTRIALSSIWKAPGEMNQILIKQENIAGKMTIPLLTKSLEPSKLQKMVKV